MSHSTVVHELCLTSDKMKKYYVRLFSKTPLLPYVFLSAAPLLSAHFLVLFSSIGLFLFAKHL